MLLAIDTAARQLGVAVVDGERLLSRYELLVDYPHAVELPGAVSRVLKAAGTTLSQLDAIAVDIGPGSFTGLRIGLAFVKALCFTRHTPVIGVPSLEILAAALPYTTARICPVLDARQKNVYAACYRWQEETLVRDGDYYLGPPEPWVKGLAGKEPMIFLGDGAGVYHTLLQEHAPNAHFAPQECWLPSAATLARLAQARHARGEHDAARTLVPLYLYPQDCQVRGPNRPTSVLA